MRQNKILKKSLLLGTVSLVGVISTVAVSCEVRQTSNNSIKPPKPTNPDKPSTPPQAPKIPIKTPNKNNESEKTAQDLETILNSVKVSLQKSNLNVYSVMKKDLRIYDFPQDSYNVDVEIVERNNEAGSVTITLVLSEKSSNLKSKLRTLTVSSLQKLSAQDEIFQKELLNIKLDYDNKANVKAHDALIRDIMITGYNTNKYKVEVNSTEYNPENPTELIVNVVIEDITTNIKSRVVSIALTGFKGN